MDMLAAACAIRSKEFAAQVNDRPAFPLHTHAPGTCDFCYNGGVKIFFTCCSEESINIFRCEYDCHTFLAFRDRQFGTVQSSVFFRDCIQIYLKAVCQLTYGY